MIPGGLGGVGILAAVERTHAGVGKVVLSGRSGRSKDTNFYGIAEESKQTAVTVVRCDVASREESSFACVVAQAPRSTSLRAPCIQLLHAGGILRDETIGRQTAGSLGTVMSPKTIGFQRLDDALAYLPIFASVLFSSIAVLLGSMGQANYAAANASLDALAAVQSQTGLPTTSVQWGAWAHGTGGMAVRNKGTLARLERMGIGSLTPEQGLVALIVVLHKQPLIHLDIFTISPFDWGTFLEKLPQEKQTPYESFLDMRTVTRDTNSQSNFDVTIDTEDEIQSDDANSNVQDAIDEITSSVLPLLDFKSKTISEDDPLMENGLDSLGAVELRQTLSSVFKMNLPPTIIFDYPTIGALARFVTIQRSQQSRTKSHFKRRNNNDIKQSNAASTLNVQGEASLDRNRVHILSSACEYPRDVYNSKQLFSALTSGCEFQQTVPSLRFNCDELGKSPSIATFISDIASFDSELFQSSKAEVTTMDPQQRKLL